MFPVSDLMVHILARAYTASNPWLTDCDSRLANSWLLKIFRLHPRKKGREKLYYFCHKYSTQIAAQHDKSLKKTRTVTVNISVVDRHRFDVDPDPEQNFYDNADPDPDADPTPSFTRVEKSEFFFLFVPALPVKKCFILLISVKYVLIFIFNIFWTA